jgi:4'-phosphopantetheinyl transferase
LKLEPDQVDIWLARDPQLRDAAALDGLSRCLSADEHARVARMHFSEDRHQQLVTRGMVRQVLSLYVPGVAPAGWNFERNRHGRPAITGVSEAARDLQFNLAHTPGLVALAVARDAEIGVDVERADKRAPLAVARRYFSVAEVEAMEALPAEEQARRFRRLWTLKESYLKATGTGVAGGLGSMTFHIEPEGVRFERAADAAASRWVFREFQVDGEFLLALAFRGREGGTPLRVNLREFPARESGQEESAQP